jgi:hypothetical protein
LAVQAVIREVRMAHDEQVRMWECILLTGGAAPLTAADRLRWFGRWTVTGFPSAAKPSDATPRQRPVQVL